MIVGLGNPGVKYALNRHNIGFIVVQAVAEKEGWNFKSEKQANATVTKGKIEGRPIHLLLPLTYMNESGRALRLYLEYHQIRDPVICVVYDDADIPFGEMRLRSKGSSGGHNGLKSIEAHLQTIHYGRLRMGIGRERQFGRPLADYVLENFSEEEQRELIKFVDEGKQVLRRLFNEPLTVVMNTMKIPPKKEKMIQENNDG